MRYFKALTVQLEGTWNFEGTGTFSALNIQQFQIGETFLKSEVTKLKKNIGTVTVNADAAVSFASATYLFTNTEDILFSIDSALTVETGTLQNAASASIGGGLKNAIDATPGTIF